MNSQDQDFSTEQTDELLKHAPAMRAEWEQSSPEHADATAQLRILQDEINAQANALQSRRCQLVRDEARIQQDQKRLQEEKSAWAATQRYSQEATPSDDFSEANSAEIEQQIEDWKLQVAQRDEVHQSRKIAFEKQLSSMAMWEQSLAERERKIDQQQEDLSAYETKLVLSEHEIVESTEAVEEPQVSDETEETASPAGDDKLDSDNELNIDFGALFTDDATSSDEEPAVEISNQTEDENHNGAEVHQARSALADMFDLSENQLEDNTPKEAVTETEEVPATIEVPLATAAYLPTVTEPEVEEKEEDDDGEISVSEYMERLLGRCGKKEEESAEAPSPPEVVSVTQPESVPTEVVEESPFDEQLEVAPVLSEPRHKQNREEVLARRDALRALANLSARTDIAKYTTGQMHNELVLKYVLTGASFVVAAALLTSHLWGTESYFTGGLIALVVAVVMGLELLRTLLFVKRVNSVDGESSVANSLDNAQWSQKQETTNDDVSYYEPAEWSDERESEEDDVSSSGETGCSA